MKRTLARIRQKRSIMLARKVKKCVMEIKAVYLTKSVEKILIDILREEHNNNNLPLRIYTEVSIY